MLSQVQDRKEQPISFARKVLNSAQRDYCTTRKELLAVVPFTRHFRHYLLGRVFLIRADHASLVWLMRFKHPSGLLECWLTELAQYALQIEHHSGSKHLNVDGMSRIQMESACDCYIAGQDVESLPCGGWEFCHRVNSQWISFEEEVNDTMPITVRHRTSVSGQQDDLDLTHLWSDKKDRAVPRDIHSPGCMQSGALAQAYVQPDSDPEADGGTIWSSIPSRS